MEKLLRETVRINLEEFTKRRKRTEVEAVLSGEDIEEQAGTGRYPLESHMTAERQILKTP